LVIICFLTVGGYFVYRHFYPKYVPLPPRPEVVLTIIPGWNLRQVADYLVKQGFASSTAEVYKITGVPAKDIKNNQEGYLAPETIRVYKDASLPSAIDKFIAEREKQITPELQAVINKSGHDFKEVLTLASILEREVKNLADKKIVADIFWRRLKINWALQADSTVHYAVDKSGEVSTSFTERQFDSLWNTYKYPGLPPTPICNPSLDSIKAALNPAKNNYWYFLTDKSGVVHYAKTLEEQNENRVRFLN